jgi:hypothetical protein
MIRRIFAALAVAVSLASAALPSVAQAYTCTTTCTGYGNSRTCTTTCF